MYNKTLSNKLGQKLPLMYRGRGVSNRQYRNYKKSNFTKWHLCTGWENYFSYLKKYPSSPHKFIIKN